MVRRYLNKKIVTKKQSALLLSAALMLFMGCQTAATNLPNREKWQIHYQVSGGIAGLHQELTIRHDGHYKIYDRKRRQTHTLKATPEQLADLFEQIRLISRTPAGSQTVPKFRQSCADCITRQVKIGYKNTNFHHQSSQSRRIRPEYRVIFKLLHGMLKSSLAPKNQGM